MKDLRGNWYTITFEKAPAWVAAIINGIIDALIKIGFVEEDYAT